MSAPTRALARVTSPTALPVVARRRRQGRWAAVFLAPFFLLFATTIVLPLGMAGYLSLFQDRRSGGAFGLGGVTQVFVGLHNYATALGDPAFRHGFAVLAEYCVVYIPVMLVASVVFALLLDSGLAWARKVFQVTLFLPHAVPGVISALLWVYLYTPGLSPVVRALSGAGVHVDPLGTGVLPAIVNVSVWEWTGYNVVIFVAALAAVPHDVLEAAQLDGAGRVRAAWHVKLPAIRSAIAVVVLFTVIGALQLFSEPSVLAQASTAVDSNFTPNMYAYSAAFTHGDYGLAGAAAVLLAVAAGVLSFAVTRATSRRSAG